MLTTVLSFLATLGLLIAVHEFGHYRVAVACNVKVLRFSMGFGRVLLRREIGRDRCEFVLSALPFGGYVRMLDEREGHVDGAEAHRAFNRRPLWQRSAIVAAGPAANLLLAVFLYAAAHWVGMEEPRAWMGTSVAGSLADRSGLRAGDWVQATSRDAVEWEDVPSYTDLRWRVSQAALQQEMLHLAVSDREGRGRRVLRLDFSTFNPKEMDATALARLGFGAPFSEPVLGEAKVGGPAALAGLRSGDRVLKVDGVPVTDAQELRDRIRRSVQGIQGQPMQWLVGRQGRLVEVSVVPRVITQPGSPPMGRIDAFVGSPPEMVVVRRGALEGLRQGLLRTWDVSVLTVKMLGRMVVGEASLKNLSGPLTIADYAGQSVKQGWVQYLGFLALVSVSLGVLNLLPLPMLDGGHLMYHAFEAVTGRPVPDRWLDRLQRAGVALLLVMMSVALFNDVARLLGLH